MIKTKEFGRGQFLNKNKEYEAEFKISFITLIGHLWLQKKA